MRSMDSGDALHRAYPHICTPSNRRCRKLTNMRSPIFKSLRYDNMTSVTKKILGG
jgi:hypothetical protein